MDQPISLEIVLGFLATTPPFDNLDPAERADVIRIMEIQRLQGGEPVVREGDAGDAWYVVFEGEARVSKMLSSGPLPIATLKPSDCFGEMAIPDGLPRAVSVEATEPLTVFRFRRSRFEDLLEQGSLGAYKLVAAMARTLSHRQRQLTQQLRAGRGRRCSRAAGRDRDHGGELPDLRVAPRPARTRGRFGAAPTACSKPG